MPSHTSVTQGAFTLTLPDVTYDAIIFDCDGTLVDSMPVHWQAWRAAFAAYRAPFDFTWELFVSRAGVGLKDTVHELNVQFACELDAAAVVAHQLARFDALAISVEPIGVVLDFALRQREQLPLSVASGGQRHHVERSLAVAKIRDLFEVVVCQEDVKRGKPDPEMFLLAAKKMGVLPARCLVVEDSPLGIAAAERAGMPSALVARAAAVRQTAEI